MKKITGLSLLAAGLLLASCSTGKVTGTVTFKGVPCPQGSPENKTPPCQGPYPGYEVKIYDSKGGQIQAVTTNDEGVFKAKLQPGNYSVKTQNGMSPDMTRDYPFTVEKGKSVTVDAQVSTGIQ